MHAPVDVNDDSGNDASAEESLDDDAHLGDEQLDGVEENALPMQNEANAQAHEHIGQNAPVAEEAPGKRTFNSFLAK